MITRLTRQTLRGIWHALILPWTDDDHLDEARLRKEIRSFAGTGMNGMYTGGTTGEFYAQDDATFERVTAIACEEAHAIGLPIQIGCTMLSTRTVRQRVKVALRHGADGIQLALPFWLELQPAETLEFLRDVADTAGQVPLILYQTSRAKRKLLAEELARVADEVPTLIGTKDTGCDLEALRAMTSATDLAIFGGDHDLIERMAAGGTGGYCAVTGLNARLMVAIYAHIIAGRISEAKVLQDSVAKLLHEAVLPLYHKKFLMDSALDRITRTVGGGDVGLRCQKPYESVQPSEVEALRRWCQANAPVLLATTEAQRAELIGTPSA